MRWYTCFLDILDGLLDDDSSSIWACGIFENGIRIPRHYTLWFELVSFEYRRLLFRHANVC